MSSVTTSTRSGEMECDYDRNPTHLYMLIQERDWEGVQYQAVHFPQEISTYVFRSDQNTNLIKWRLLPFHAAILNEAPLETLETLLLAHAPSAQAQDDHGMLPLHLAIKKHVAPDTINMLLAAYPDSIDVENYAGLTAYQMAQKSSSRHKNYYLRAVKKGATHSAVTASMADLLCGVSLPSMESLDPRGAFGMAK